MSNDIDIKIGHKPDPVYTVTTVTQKKSTEEKEVTAKWSKKIKCPNCGHFPLEIYNFVSPNNKFICKVYVCHNCENKSNTPCCFFIREECDKI